MYRKQILEAFQLFDTDKSNTIDFNELRVVLTAIGIEPSSIELKEIIDSIASKNGEIQFEDFYTIMVSKLKEQKGLFTFLNKGQPLNLQDLIQLSMDCGEELSAEQALELFTYCDLDKDDLIGENDFNHIQHVCNDL